MLNYVHGGDIQTYIDRHGFAPLDLSANINPFGIPDAVRAAMHRAVDNCTQYPDPFCRAARQAIGAREGVNPDFLYCGNGAADVLDRLAAVLKPRKVLLTAPTFAEYERTLSGAEIRVHNLRETDGFALTERILDEISPDLDAVYVPFTDSPLAEITDCVRDDPFSPVDGKQPVTYFRSPVGSIGEMETGKPANSFPLFQNANRIALLVRNGQYGLQEFLFVRSTFKPVDKRQPNTQVFPVLIDRFKDRSRIL